MTTLAPTLSNRYFPRTTEWIRSLFLIVLGSLLLAALAQVKIVLPFTPVPITGQTLGVLLIGAALGIETRRGFDHPVSHRRRAGFAFLCGRRIGHGYFYGSNGWLPAGICRRRVCYWSAGRTRVGKKRAHFAHPLYRWHGHYLYLWCCLAVCCAGKFQ